MMDIPNDKDDFKILRVSPKMDTKSRTCETDLSTAGPQSLPHSNLKNPACSTPNEIWVKILSHLGQKDIVRARTVCSTWRNVIDEHFQFSVIVFDEKTDLNRIYELKIKDCLITKLIEDVDIIQYPDLLRRARFWGSINPVTLRHILSKATNLEELSMLRYPLAQNDIFSDNTMLPLKKLIKLEVLGYCCKDVSEEVSHNITRLLSREMPSLNKVFLNATCYWKYMDIIVAGFFDFLAKHRKHITHVNVSLIPAANGHELISHLPTLVSEATKDAIYSKELQLESLRLSVASKYIRLWTPLIEIQSKLTDLRVHWVSSSEQPQSNLTGIAGTLLYPAIIQSAMTLVYVELRELNLTVDDRRNAIPFDASIFKCAQSLRRLVLVRNKEDCQRNVELYGAPTIINLNNHLPLLEDLEIVRFKCLCSELQPLIDHADALKSVKLQHTGTSYGQGVHGGIIESITQKPGIKILNICPVNYHDSEENVKLEIVKSRFAGIYQGSDHVYFDFDRLRKGIPQPQSRHYQTVEVQFSADQGTHRMSRRQGDLGVPRRRRGTSYFPNHSHASTSAGPCTRSRSRWRDAVDSTRRRSLSEGSWKFDRCRLTGFRSGLYSTTMRVVNRRSRSVDVPSSNFCRD